MKKLNIILITGLFCFMPEEASTNIDYPLNGNTNLVNNNLSTIQINQSIQPTSNIQTTVNKNFDEEKYLQNLISYEEAYIHLQNITEDLLSQSIQKYQAIIYNNPQPPIAVRPLTKGSFGIFGWLGKLFKK